MDSTVAARNNALAAMGGVKIDVFLRIRPPMSREEKAKDAVVVEVTGDTQQQVALQVNSGNNRADKYKFDRVFDQGTDQATVFDEAVSPIVDQVARGMSCTLFAYGQTGAGKTYTMRGKLDGSSETNGVIQRSVSPPTHCDFTVASERACPRVGAKGS